MTGTAGIVVAEAGAEALRAEKLAVLTKNLERWLETSGPMLRLAAVSPTASDLVHAYRTTRDIAAASGGELALECYKHVCAEFAEFVKSAGIDKELRSLVELEVRRADALITEAGKWGKRSATATDLARPVLTQEGAELLHGWSDRMKAADVPDALRATYAKLLSRIGPEDYAWAAIAEIATARAASVKQQFPSITRATYAQNKAAQDLVEIAYASHGKGEMFEHLARNSENVKGALDGELRAAGYRAAERGAEFSPVLSAGELRLGSELPDGTVGGWKKFADTGVLVAAERGDAAAQATAGAATKGVRIDGVAQPSALFEFKAEKGISDIPAQQERALPRMVERWATGEPVYVAVGIADESGEVTTKYFLLQPPDSKAGLSYYGVGTSNAFIANREVLAAQGAMVRNMLLDVSNDEMRSLWYELFWTAFESVK